MQYALLIYDDEAVWGAMAEAERDALMGEYGAFGAALREAGAMLGGEQLQPTATATTVRVRDGETLATDGPFVETKEAFGGFYLIEADSLDDALAWAARIPSARLGAVEVRPIVSAPVPAGS